MRVLLVCAGGMSTSMLMKKMSKYAAEHGIDLEIAARGANEVKNGDGWVVVLLGHQIGYQADKIKAKLGDTPMDVMPMLEYGRQNCEAIFARIDKALGK